MTLSSNLWSFRLGICLVLAAWNLGMASALEPTPAAKLVAEPRVLIIAHRGNSSEFPENTLPAFDSAVKLKSDLVELDYYHSSDNKPIVFHDKTLDRTTNAKKLWGGEKLSIQKYPLAELRTLDAGAWFNASFAGTKLPTLEESLDVIQTGSTTLVEHKQGDAKTCIDILTQKNILDKVVVQSFDWKYVADCRKLAPTLTLAALGGKEFTTAKLDELAQSGPNIVAWDHKGIGPVEIKQIHDRGYKAWVYTVDDPARAKELIAAGIDGIITNVPGKLKPLVAK